MLMFKYKYNLCGNALIALITFNKNQMSAVALMMLVVFALIRSHVFYILANRFPNKRTGRIPSLHIQ